MISWQSLWSLLLPSGCSDRVPWKQTSVKRSLLLPFLSLLHCKAHFSFFLFQIITCRHDVINSQIDNGISFPDERSGNHFLFFFFCLAPSGNQNDGSKQLSPRRLWESSSWFKVQPANMWLLIDETFVSNPFHSQTISGLVRLPLYLSHRSCLVDFDRVSCNI